MTRRWRSFKCGRTTSKNRASTSGLTTTSSGYYARSNVRWTLSVSGHHSPCSEHRPTYEPGDDDADRHGGRLRNEEWISVAVAWPSSAAAEHGKTARRQVGHGNTDNRALQVQHVGDSYPGE